ncbi:MAG: hypothetical protein ACM3SY_12510 [Candidatus Omnitrophota bacterium]
MPEHCIAIIAAMNMEFNYIKKKMAIKKSGWEKGFKTAMHISGDLRIILIKSGMGLEKAYRATRFLLENHDICAVINIGIAGALKPGLNIGDLVLGEEIGEEINSKDHKIYRSHTRVVEILKKILFKWQNSGIKKKNWYKGNIISVKKLVGKERKCLLYRKFNALVADMEAAAIIKVCENIPFATIKSISDPADESLGMSEDVMTDQGKINLGKLIPMLIFHPLSTVKSFKYMIKSMKSALSSLEFLIKELPAMAEALKE